jgi:hypothetical protein
VGNTNDWLEVDILSLFVIRASLCVVKSFGCLANLLSCLLEFLLLLFLDFLGLLLNEPIKSKFVIISILAGARLLESTFFFIIALLGCLDKSMHIDDLIN